MSKMSDQDIIDRQCSCASCRATRELERERCAKKCEELAEDDVLLLRVGAYLNAANEIRGEE